MNNRSSHISMKKQAKMERAKSENKDAERFCKLNFEFYRIIWDNSFIFAVRNSAVLWD